MRQGRSLLPGLEGDYKDLMDHPVMFVEGDRLASGKSGKYRNRRNRVEPIQNFVPTFELSGEAMRLCTLV